MDDMSWALRRLGRAALVSTPLFILFIYASFQQKNESTSGGWAIVGFLSTLGMVFLLAKPAATVVATFIANQLTDYILSSGGKLAPPPPLYKTAEWLVEKGRYEEAVTEYERIIQYHPQELRAHLALLKIWRQYVPDVYNERAVFRRAKRCIKNKADRMTLEDQAPRRL